MFSKVDNLILPHFARIMSDQKKCFYQQIKETRDFFTVLNLISSEIIIIYNYEMEHEIEHEIIWNIYLEH